MSALDDQDLCAAFDELEAAVSGFDLTRAAPAEGDADSEIPTGLVAYVESICRSPWVSQQVLEVAGGKVLRRLRGDTEGARRARWAKRWAPENREATKRWLGQVRDRVVRLAHQGQVAEHLTSSILPPATYAWQADSSGALVTHAPATRNPSFGSAAYLEQTPIEVIRWVHQTWQRERASGSGSSISVDDPVGPQVWDLTAGSGTASDYFEGVRGSLVVASDCNVVPAAGVVQADCRAVGTLDQHRGVARAALLKPSTVVRRPDLILFDPPSRGRPTHAELYHGTCPARDLALLAREKWLMAIAFTIAEAVRHLAVGGFLSLLLRCGSRNHGAIEADASAIEDLKEIMGNRVHIADVMPIVVGNRVNQASLGPSRVPAVHLRIERAR